MVVRFDWLTFTVDVPDSLDQMVNDLFGLDVNCFVTGGGRYGYRRSLFYEHITILLDGGLESMGICFDISGQGCSFLYGMEGFLFEDIFRKINGLGGNITRLDVALDCFDNEVPYDELLDAIPKHNYASIWRNVKVITSYYERTGKNCAGTGLDVQFGSRKSDIMLRIYDKKVESKCEDKDYWCRFELQCRNHMAYSFADTYLNLQQDLDFIEMFLGVLTHYLRFIDRKYVTDPNKCPVLPWWESFVELVAKSIILRHEKYEQKTIEQLVYNVSTRFSQCYRAFLDLFGQDALLDLISNCELKNRDYISLVSFYKMVHPLQRQKILDIHKS